MNKKRYFAVILTFQIFICGCFKRSDEISQNKFKNIYNQENYTPVKANSKSASTMNDNKKSFSDNNLQQNNIYIYKSIDAGIDNTSDTTQKNSNTNNNPNINESKTTSIYGDSDDSKPYSSKTSLKFHLLTISGFILIGVGFILGSLASMIILGAVFTFIGIAIMLMRAFTEAFLCFKSNKKKKSP